MPEIPKSTDAVARLTVHWSAVITDKHGREHVLPDLMRFWPTFRYNLRRCLWRSVLHNLVHDAPRALLRR